MYLPSAECYFLDARLLRKGLSSSWSSWISLSNSDKSPLTETTLMVCLRVVVLAILMVTEKAWGSGFSRQVQSIEGIMDPEGGVSMARLMASMMSLCSCSCTFRSHNNHLSHRAWFLAG